MGEITVQSLTTAGLTASYTTAAFVGDEFLNNGHVLIHVKNGAASTNTITITSQVSPVPKGFAAADISIEVSANGEAMIGFFDMDAYNDSSGYVQVGYTTHTDLTIAAISVT